MMGEVSELWKITAFRRLLIARVVSNIGNGITPIALAFGVLSIPGADAGSLSYVTTAQMIPLVLFMLVGGVAADRFGRSQLVGITDIVGSIFVGISALSFLTSHASIPLLCFNGFIFGMLNALWYPAFSGIMPIIVPAKLLQAANSTVGLAANAGFTVGASIAGVLVSTAGSGWGLLVDAFSFLVAGILVLRMKLPRNAQPEEGEARETIFAQLRGGWYEFSSRRWIVIVVVCFAFFHMGFEGFLGVLAPVQMKEALGGAKDMGIMMFGFGVGAVSGTALALKLRPQRPLVLAVGVCPIVGLWILSLAVPMPIWVLFLMAMAGGIALDLMYANWMTTIQTNVPQEALSRVGSYDAFGSLAFAPLGLFFAGPLTHLVGARTALIAVGLMVFIAALLPLASSEVRHLKAVTHAEND
jgi:MFS family permease